MPFATRQLLMLTLLRKYVQDEVDKKNKKEEEVLNSSSPGNWMSEKLQRR